MKPLSHTIPEDWRSSKTLERSGHCWSRSLALWLGLLLVVPGCGDRTRANVIGTWVMLDEDYALMYLFPSGEIRFANGLPIDANRTRALVNFETGTWDIDRIGRLCYTRGREPTACADYDAARVAGVMNLRLSAESDTFAFRRLSAKPDTVCWRLELADSLMSGLVMRHGC